MLNHTKKIKEIYEEIQKKIYYIIPEKWEKLYLYASVIDMPDKKTTGELFFYYVPKGIFKKKPVNAYEIPSRFNLDETEYLKLVENLYKKIKQLREEFKKNSIVDDIWSNITISIHNLKFKVEYDYDDLVNTFLCDLNTGTCATKDQYDWLFNTTTWTNIKKEEDVLYYLYVQWSIDYDSYSNDYFVGVRPVIIISKDYF